MYILIVDRLIFIINPLNYNVTRKKILLATVFSFAHSVLIPAVVAQVIPSRIYTRVYGIVFCLIQIILNVVTYSLVIRALGRSRNGSGLRQQPNYFRKQFLVSGVIIFVFTLRMVAYSVYSTSHHMAISRNKTSKSYFIRLYVCGYLMIITIVIDPLIIIFFFQSTIEKSFSIVFKIFLDIFHKNVRQKTG